MTDRQCGHLTPVESAALSNPFLHDSHKERKTVQAHVYELMAGRSQKAEAQEEEELGADMAESTKNWGLGCCWMRAMSCEA